VTSFVSRGEAERLEKKEALEKKSVTP